MPSGRAATRRSSTPARSHGAGGTAISFAGGGNTLTLAPGSVINGTAHGFGADTFQLGGTTGADTLDAGLFATQYSGYSTFNKIGGSTWTLTGTNATAMPWTVSGGILDVNGTLANASMTVNAGGTLGGSGTVGNTTIASGGTLLPGNGTPGSFLSVTGNLAFQSGALYLVEVSPATSTLTRVTGTATLNGLAGASFAPGSYVSKQYTILTAAGGVTGTFSGLQTLGLPSGFTTSLSYDAKDAYLNLALNFTPPSSGPNFGGGLNVNQQNVANALTNFFNATGGIPMVFGTLTPAGLTQVSGELATGSQQATFDAMNLFMGLLTDPFVAGRGDGPTSGASAPTGYASTQTTGPARDAYAMFTKAPPVVPFEQRWSVWAAGFGGSQTTDGNATLGSNTATSSVYGTAVGADYRISPFTVAGFALAGGGTNFQCRGQRLRAFRPVPGRRVHPSHGWAGLHLGRTRLWLAGHHHQSHRDRGRPRSTARAVQRQCVLGTSRRRLSFCHAVDGRHRHHALRRRAVHDLRSAGLCRAGHRRLECFCTRL